MTKEQALEQPTMDKAMIHTLAKENDELKAEIGRLRQALEQQTNDCKIFGTKENCFGGATENECEHCDYKIQKLEQSSDDCVSRQAVIDSIDSIREHHGGMLDIRQVVTQLPPVTPIFPKGATNGDMIKAMFPNGEYGTNGNFVHVYISYFAIIQTMTFDLSWWNAPYKRGDSDGSN